MNESEIYILPPDFKIVSGGQTGADQAGLDWAINHEVNHGGWCPKGRRSEDGPIDSIYELTETPSSKYLERTEWNVRDSDATVIFTMDEKLDGGSKKTAEFAQKLGKPVIHMRPRVHPKCLAKFLSRYQVKTLNIAGKRETSAPGVSKYVLEVLDQVLKPTETAAE
ncbi:hypothetical protein A1353_20180 [Methylomonas methanica]|uniref:Molybdenum carrier n=1 Tax=Methylomonas methanica TaxID=421 RepID=A0A177M1Z9_METMH|nr:putative molybdenum carrier protein [Methylomonas methanica]OAH99736.1 hypothetical protein A1353_20180 [Methylomonas methanica]